MRVGPEIDNLIATYCSIAETVPHTVVSHPSGATICLGSFAHPLCNFAIVTSCEGLEVAVAAGEGRPHFNIYTVDPKLDLTGRGYRCTQVLSAMRCRLPAAGAKFEPAGSTRERLAIARFMTSQFFAGQRIEIRDRVSDANARAAGLEVYGVVEGQRLVAAGMLHETKEVVGIYNLCVDTERRGTGLGTDIARRLLGEIGRRGLDATLQCEASVCTWYRRFGFVDIASIKIWSLVGA